MTLENWLTRLGEADKDLKEVAEELRNEFWNLVLGCIDEYQDTGNMDEKDAVYIMLKKLYDWLPMEVVRFFFLEALQGKVDRQ